MKAGKLRSKALIVGAGMFGMLMAGAGPVLATDLFLFSPNGNSCNYGGSFTLPAAQPGDRLVLNGLGSGQANCPTTLVSGSATVADETYNGTPNYDRVWTFSTGGNAVITVGTGNHPTTFTIGTETSGRSDAGASASNTTYTVTFDAGDDGTCTVSSVSGKAGSWVRLPKADVCSKSGAAFVAWEARTEGRPVTRFPAESMIALTGDNVLHAVWQRESASAPTSSTSTRWVVWRWDSDGRQIRPVSADLGSTPVVTIHAPKASAVSPKMVKAAKTLAASHGGTYAGIVTETKWTSARIVAAYER